MRPAKVTDDEIITEGKELERLKIPINGWSLRKKLAAGKPERLEKVWLKYKGVNPELTDKHDLHQEHILPRSIEEALQIFIDKFSVEVRGIVTLSDADAIEIADVKAKSIYKSLEEDNHNFRDQLSIATSLIEEADKKIEILSAFEQKRQLSEDKLVKLDKEFAMLLVKSEGLETLLSERQKLVAEKSERLVHMEKENEEKKLIIDKIRKVLTKEQLNKLEAN